VSPHGARRRLGLRPGPARAPRRSGRHGRRRADGAVSPGPPRLL